MTVRNLKHLPLMLYADPEGRIYEHPYLRMAGFSGPNLFPIEPDDLIIMPEFSKLFYIPACPPLGLDPHTGQPKTIYEMDVDGKSTTCFAVAVFLEPGFVRTHLPAADYSEKSFVLPSWAYGAVGFRDGQYWSAGFEVEYNERWDPRHYDDRELVPAISDFMEKNPTGPLVNHLTTCATENHCFAAKNLFLKRWEAPLPLSRKCNATCLGCLSLQPGASFEASHERIRFTPSMNEIVNLAVAHLNHAPKAIVSFGQGCEGEPLTEYELIAESIQEIRKRTRNGTINLNTNGSFPDRIRKIAENGLDSIRISLNSARPEFYGAYYRPKGYGFVDVMDAIALSRKMGLYTMINYLVFPGISDQAAEMDALTALISKTGINFLHLKNLCIDPAFYLEKIPATGEKGVGIRKMAARLTERFPDLILGYFNQPVR
ncbi:MAG: radical SAM protein [Deltaproteobacteria bacterium]|jgi:pyruvate-formate lyase-activating enzyme|nr:radical SAM protein [Deltaproteobacteria bacterium]